jgi:hypothetical protein
MRSFRSRPIDLDVADRGSTMSASLLMWGVLFGAIGLGFFVYGKKQRAIVPLLCGVALMALPYFIDDAWLLVVVGAGLVAVPYFVRV